MCNGMITQTHTLTHKKSRKSCRRDVENEGDLSENRKKRSQESVGSVAADPNNLENSKEAEREPQGTQGLRKNCICKECVLFVASDQ